ncbi:MAG: tryptophan synthase subunit beta [Actinomycetota bacterium]|nr:tryptophan synthase subunit beta [Actinomycetota bacterium]
MSPDSAAAVPNNARAKPGYFGRFGGRFVPEALFGALEELVAAWESAQRDPSFEDELDRLRRDYGGRPTPLYLAERLSEAAGVAVHLKREDLAHTGSHKLNNVLGQALLARRMGKPRVIAETGAGQHGVATATAAALLGLRCVIYMGEEDCRRQRLNLVRMRLLGAEVVPVGAGTRTLKDAINEAMRDWVTNVTTTHYLMGSVVGPHPFPGIVRDLQRVIGEEALTQFRGRTGHLPDAVIACVGGGSNAIGSFHAFQPHREVQLIGVEAAGEGLGTGHSAATLSEGREAVLHGARSWALIDGDGQVLPAHSISAGLDYPGVGPEHAWLKETARATYVAASDAEALAGFRRLCELEGIIPALEPAHAVGWLLAHGRRLLDPGAEVVVTLSGRGDKDVDEVARLLGLGRAGGPGGQANEGRAAGPGGWGDAEGT